ncbi:MAG: LamB/YcsF family protein [Cyanobacteria bacterium]|nr:LamB/YcsF family protein [Cyanobacteriota bacterium]
MSYANKPHGNRRHHHGGQSRYGGGGNRPNTPRTPQTTLTPPPPQRQKRFIDINTDFGQSADKRLFEPIETSLLSYVSSVNIPCCVHDGTPREVLEAIVTAKQSNCVVGAHIGYPDPANSGYAEMNISDEDLVAWLYVQLGTFRALVQANGIDVDHVRPHGALYAQMIDNPELTRLVAETLYKVNPWYILIGPAGPVLDEVAQKVGIRTAPEMYIGKRYTNTGVLDKARLHESLASQAALDQARQLLNDNSVTASDGTVVKVKKFGTLHISPRQDGAVMIAEKLKIMLGQPYPLSLASVGDSGWV